MIIFIAIDTLILINLLIFFLPQSINHLLYEMSVSSQFPETQGDVIEVKTFKLPSEKSKNQRMFDIRAWKRI